MRSRAITDMADLKDPDLFDEIASGLLAIHENANKLSQAVRILTDKKNGRGANILEAIAKEEASKYLILLDAVRCPRAPEDRFINHLKKFYQHLAKGLYANACNWRSADFREVRNLIKEMSKKYYLDGPNDVDWIFENWIIRQREEMFYVDYIANEGNSSGEGHMWLSPRRFDNVHSFGLEPAVVEIINDLHMAGYSKSESLNIIAELWRPIDFNDDSSRADLHELNLKTLQQLQKKGLIAELDDSRYRHIVYHWPFPLYDINMEKIKTNKKELKEIQERWYPEF